MKRIVSVVLVSLVCFGASVASAAIYSGKEVNVEKLHAALSERFNATKEGKIIVVVNKGAKMAVMIDEKKELVTLRIGFSDVNKDRQKVLELCNRYNDEKVFARFCVDKDGDICIDHFIAFDGSLDTKNLIGSINWLYSVVESFTEEFKNL